MADFKTAMDYLLGDEGKFADVPGDPGGATNWGITLRRLTETVPGATIQTLKSMGRLDAVSWYKQFCWIPNFEGITDQALCNKLFSTYANMDADAVKFVQRGLRDLFKIAIDDDGVFGSRTLAATNSVDATKLLREFRVQQAVHYAQEYGKAPYVKGKFLDGWMRRAFED